MLSLLLILLQAIIVPLDISLFMDSNNFTIQILEVIINVYFTFDIILQFNLGYYEQADFITSRRRIALRYLRF